MAETATINAWEEFLTTLSPEERITVSNFQELSEFLEWSYAQPELKNNPFDLWEAKKEVSIPPAGQLAETAERPGEEIKKVHEGGLRHRELAHVETYGEFKQRVAEEAEAKADEWEKNPDFEKAKTREEAVLAAQTEAYDNFVKKNQAQAEAWIKSDNDQNLSAALERKKAANEIAAQKKATQGSQGLRQRASTLARSSSKARSKVEAKLKNPMSYLERLFKKSFLGSLASAASGLIGAVLGAITTITIAAIGVASSLLGTIAEAVTSLIAGTATLSIGALLTVTIVPIIVVFILAVIIAITHPNPDQPQQYSPYPGIFYTIAGPAQVSNGQTITDVISFSYDPNAATCPLNGISIFDDLPALASLVQDPALTTGNYGFSDGRVTWRLINNAPDSSSSQIVNYTFKITLLPQDDTVIDNTISIDGCGP